MQFPSKDSAFFRFLFGRKQRPLLIDQHDKPVLRPSIGRAGFAEVGLALLFRPLAERHDGGNLAQQSALIHLTGKLLSRGTIDLSFHHHGRNQHIGRVRFLFRTAAQHQDRSCHAKHLLQHSFHTIASLQKRDFRFVEIP